MPVCSFHKYLSRPTTIFSTFESKNANAALIGGRVQILEIPQQFLRFGIWKIWTFAPVCAPKPVQKYV